MSSIRKSLWVAGVGGRAGSMAMVALLAVGAMRLAAQEPMDDPGWQQRCSTLDASMMAIDKGAAPPELLATTAGIPGEKFAAIARERSAASQHWVACTLFFTAAMAERQGNGGKVNTARAHSDVVLGFGEMKLGQGKSLGFAAKMMRAEESVMAFKDPAITPADLAAVLGAFGAMGGPPMGGPGGGGFAPPGGPGYPPPGGAPGYPPPGGAPGYAPPGGPQGYAPPGGPQGYPPPGAPAAGFAPPDGNAAGYPPPGGAPPADPAAAPATATASTGTRPHRATTHPARKPGAAPAPGTAPATTPAAPHA
ncbi:MAG: hypothetical protein V4555_15145 [Acidobacteriota bacterium]